MHADSADKPHRRHLGRRIVPWFIAMSVILLVAAGLIYRGVSELISSSGWVAHSYQILDTLDLAEARFTDAQSAERGYVATCNRTMLSPYRNDLPRVYSDLATLRMLTADNPAQQERVETLHRVISVDFSRMSTVISTASGDQKDAEKMLADPTDRIDTANVLSVLQQMENEERRLLAMRIRDMNFFARATLAASALGVFACVFILGFVFWLVRRETKQREEAQASLHQTNAQLETSLADLRSHSAATRSIALLGELLQTCRNTKEALAIAARHLAQLFPDAGGTIGLFSNSRDLIECPQTMGSDENFAREFVPDDCWGLRRGRLHGFAQEGSEPRCAHLPADVHNSLCVPLIAQGETLGVLSIATTAASGFSDIEQRTVQTIAEQLSLALANLKLQETLRYQSLRDPLTGLFNRRYLEDALARELARTRRNNQPLSVVILDIDHFKRFNDTYGHQGGDALLAEFGQLLAGHARDEDIACRYGGEEFALILPGASLSVATERADRLREAVKHLHVQLNGQPLGLVTLSAGVADSPVHGKSGAAVIGAADAALYRAKQNGRDRVECAGQTARANARAAG